MNECLLICIYSIKSYEQTGQKLFNVPKPYFVTHTICGKYVSNVMMFIFQSVLLR